MKKIPRHFHPILSSLYNIQKSVCHAWWPPDWRQYLHDWPTKLSLSFYPILTPNVFDVLAVIGPVGRLSAEVRRVRTVAAAVERIELVGLLVGRFNATIGVHRQRSGTLVGGRFHHSGRRSVMLADGRFHWGRPICGGRVICSVRAVRLGGDAWLILIGIQTRANAGGNMLARLERHKGITNKKKTTIITTFKNRITKCPGGKVIETVATEEVWSSTRNLKLRCVKTDR